MPASRALRGVTAALVLSALVVTAHGCDLYGCGQAMDVVCDCSSKPCDRKPRPGIVKKLEECDPDVIVTDYNLPACIREGPGRYCRFLDAMLEDPRALCDLDCSDNACDLEGACHRYQARHCDVPPGQGGAGGE